MGKKFTIAKGLETIGALHTGGQGSVYKGKRIGEIFVAVKILPTPILTESPEDNHYKDFTNEVEKLKKVNEVSNPNVVKILGSGLTETGSMPYIEMEFIEGPDLAELLTEKDTPVFTIPEAIKVAYQLANALSHCHLVGVKHGDIKSNNVKFNTESGNYVLLDFGLAIMSHEQRRSSLRNAGAVEFMAPEQGDGNLLPQSDIYSYGIILYELLAGTVPFKLNDDGQTARNAVMIAHTEQPPPDLLALREKNMPLNWPREQRQREMQVPEWLLALIYKCLQKAPEERYADGAELRQAIQNSVLTVKTNTEGALILENEKASLQALLQAEQEKSNRLQTEIIALKKNTLPQTVEAPHIPAVAPPVKSNEKSIPKTLLAGIAFLLFCVGAAAGHYLPGGKKEAVSISSPDTLAVIKKQPDNVAVIEPKQDTVEEKKPVVRHETDSVKPVKKVIPPLLPPKKTNKDSAKKVVKKTAPKPEKTTPPATPVIAVKGNGIGKVYSLFTTYAYFHSRPDAGSKRSDNVNQWDNARLRALDDQNGYVYVSFTNKSGETMKGWLNKKDLIVVGQ